jgi:hypothetical protein
VVKGVVIDILSVLGVFVAHIAHFQIQTPNENELWESHTPYMHAVSTFTQLVQVESSLRSGTRTSLVKRNENIC